MISENSHFTVILQGGLGNQLFQFFAGRYFSMKSGIPVLFDAKGISSPKKHINSDIQDFGFTVSEEFLTSSGCLELRGTIDRAEIFFTKRVPRYGALRQINAVNDVHFSREIRVTSGEKLVGYFQCREYFEEYRKMVGDIDWSIRSERRTPIRIPTDITSRDNVVLHVRGGDFLKNQSQSINLGINYYRAAIQSFELGKNSQIFVFTDDYNHAIEQLKGIPNLEFVDQSGLRASEVMVFMSRAHNLVISNSTFSYWSATASEARIAAPSNWLKGAPEVHRIYPKNWTVISSN